MVNGTVLGSGKFYFYFCFLGPHLRHREVPRLGVEWELQLLAYTTATTTQGPSHICDLHHSSQQRRILNPLNKAGDRTCILMDSSQVLNPLSHSRNSLKLGLVSSHQSTNLKKPCPPAVSWGLDTNFCLPDGHFSILACVSSRALGDAFKNPSGGLGGRGMRLLI